MSKVLVADDDHHIREMIEFTLQKANFDVVLAQDGQQALALCEAGYYDLIVLDINMPEMDGLECCRHIRRISDVPILFLSSRDDEIDRILGLEIGGDDYVTKPFSPRELVARIKVILRRTQPKNSTVSAEPKHQSMIHLGHLSMDREEYSCRWKQQTINLTVTEFSILLQLLKHPKRVFSREQIMRNAYDNNIHVSDRTIDSHIRHIRQKFSAASCDAVIDTQHGIGYKLSACQ